MLAVAILATTLPLQVLYFTPDYWNPQKTLPIQLCDLASLVSAYALWTHRWWAVGLTYYWGLFLTTQAIVTPDLDSGFPDPIFLLFWGMHIGTVWAAVHLTWGRGVVPDWRSYRFAVAATATWAVSLFCLNLRPRHQLRLPQPQARRGLGARPARAVAVVRPRRDRDRGRRLGAGDLAVGPQPRPCA